MADLSEKYNTKLSKEDETLFQQWAATNPRLGNTYDYDARGFWKSGAGAADNGHGSDEFKKPNHPTFSDESMYHGIDGNKGGKWGKNGNKDTFTPSKTNMENMSASDMQDYFSKIEPNAELVMPKTRSQKWYDNSAPTDADNVPPAATTAAPAATE